MIRLRQLLLLGFASLSFPTALHAQDGLGPITTRTLLAHELRTKLTAAQREELKRGTAGADLVAFLDSPFEQLAKRGRAPSDSIMDVARKLAIPRAAALDPVAEAGAGALGREAVLIYGIADFVIARAKAEVTAATLRQSRGWFNKDLTLQGLFPLTREIVSKDADATPQTLSLLRDAAQEDLNSLPTNAWSMVRARCLADTMTSPRPAGTVACAQDAGRKGGIDALRTAAALTESFIKKQSPLTALTATAHIDDSQFLTRAGRIATHSAAVMAGEAANGQGEAFADLFGDEKTVYFAIAFFADTVLTDRDTLVIPAGVDTLQKNLKELARKAASASQAFASVHRELNNLRTARSMPVAQRREQYAALVQSFIAACEDVATLGASLGLTRIDAAAAPYIENLKTAANIAEALAEQNYVAATAQGLRILPKVGVEPGNTVKRWVSFAGGLASATEPEEVTLVLEQFALPPASYAAKRFPPAEQPKKGSVHINSYLGLLAGTERIRHGTAETDASQFRGGFLPIGLEVTLAGPTSLLLSVIDLGVVASYRYDDPNSETAPDIKFSSVFAPGAFFTLAPWETWPIAAGFGWEFAPRLRSLTTGTGNERRDATRWGAFLAVDVPLFRLR